MSKTSQVRLTGFAKGLDVSHHNGEIDWQLMYGQGYRFMFSKCTEGQNIIDKTFYINYNKAKDAGFITGAYHFFRPNEDVMSQYHNFMFNYGKPRDNDLPPVLDWEVSYGMDPEFQKKQALTWCKAIVAETGKTPIIYSSPAYLEKLGDLSDFKDYFLWIAHWGVETPTVPPPWSKWLFWQYEATEMDKDNFNGTIDDLKAFVS